MPKMLLILTCLTIEKVPLPPQFYDVMQPIWPLHFNKSSHISFSKKKKKKMLMRIIFFLLTNKPRSGGGATCMSGGPKILKIF